MKARTVLNTRQPSKATMNQVLAGRSSEARQISFGNFPNSGALPIIINGNQFIGAVGSEGRRRRCRNGATRSAPTALSPR
jgi:uncharacterized protein GlcG (DUF336 family)